MVKIAPSILSAKFSDIENEVIKVDQAGADYIHIDVMDGQYVPNITFGPNIVRTLRPITNKVLDVHLMIKPVENFIESFVSAGADIITFHPEADPNPLKVLKIIKKYNLKAGIAIHPDIKVTDMEIYLNIVDIVTVMTVMPGLGGQKFLDKELHKIKFLKNIKNKKNLSFEIEVDGGINDRTAKICKKNGADVLIAGSYIYKSTGKKYKNLIESLR